MLKTVTTDLSRLQEIARVVVRHGYGHLMTRSRRLSQAAKDASLGNVVDGEAASAERFARLLEDLGPTFVKLGQILSTRPDILPPSFITALSRLQDQVPPLSFDVVEVVLEASLAAKVDAHLQPFQEEPLASASIAQVHAAVLKDGQEVVVKIQRPAIAERMAADISLLGILAGVFDAVFEEAGIYKSSVVVEEFEAALLAELDFTSELRNLTAFHTVQQKKQMLHIPKVFPELCSRTILVMERMRGTRLSDLPSDFDRKGLAERFLASAFEQVFVDGLFHGDPHPGNVLIQEDGSIALLDFGLVGRLSRDSQDRLVALLLAVVLRDADSLARLLYRMGDAEDRVSLGAFRAAIHTLLDRYMGLELSDIKSPALFRDLMDLTVKHRIRIPREYAVLGKTCVTFEGVIRELHPTLDIAQMALPYAMRLIKERYDPRTLEGGGPRLLLQLLGFAQDLPLQLSQILLDMEAGKLTVRVGGAGIHELARAVRMLGLSVVAAGICAALVSGAVGELIHLDVKVGGMPLVPVVALGMAFLLLLAVTLYVVFDGRVPKARLRTFLKFLGLR